MFTGIVEATGRVRSVRKDGGNVHFEIEAPFLSELKIDQSVAHNGTCLTVVSLTEATYTVTAIDETLQKTNLGDLIVGSTVNLERCMILGGRLDGHIVQGHVDQTGVCTSVEDQNGSWKYTIEYDTKSGHVTVPKGSITVNGVSLTVVDSLPGKFSVAIIPYTFEHTTFGKLKSGDKVNLEFDIIGKYVAAMYNASRS
jgi:riboflavin synthase